MKKMKLLFVISNTSIGGPQKSLLALLDKINYDKYNVDVLVLNPGGKLLDYFNENINIIIVEKIVTALTLPKEKLFDSLFFMLKNMKFKMFFDSLVSVLKHVFFKKNMNQERQKNWVRNKKYLSKIDKEYDISFGILGLSTYFLVDLVQSTKKFHWIRSDTRILKRNELIDSKYYKQLDGFIAVSNETSNIFEDIYPFSKGKMNVLYNYIPHTYYENLPYDNSLMKVPSKIIKLLTISRLDPLKGLDLAVEACKYLINMGYNIKWFILGDGKYRKDIETLIDKHKMAEYFVLLGFQLNTLAFIEDADIVVHPSRTEGKSNAVDEAKFIGKPIVVTRYDTVKEQIEDEVTGLIAEIDSKNLAQKIIEVIDNPKLQKKLVKNCLSLNETEININDFFIKLYMNEGN